MAPVSFLLIGKTSPYPELAEDGLLWFKTHMAFDLGKSLANFDDVGPWDDEIYPAVHLYAHPWQPGEHATDVPTTTDPHGRSLRPVPLDVAWEQVARLKSEPGETIPPMLAVLEALFEAYMAHPGTWGAIHYLS